MNHLAIVIDSPVNFFGPPDSTVAMTSWVREKSDYELIAAYAQEHDELAFAEIVRRHVGFVHASARRQARDPHRVEEITQAVFILLARKAPSIRSDVILSGWLFRAVRFAAADLRKSDLRRQERETNAYHHMLMETSGSVGAPSAEDEEKQWHQMSAVLDECLAKLGEADRHALLLRFFEDKPLAEVGQALRITADAARKRVTRALGKLQVLLRSYGIQSTVVALESSLLLHGASPASGELAASTMAAVFPTVALPQQLPSVSLADAIFRQLAWANLRPWLAAASVVLTLGVGVGLRYSLADSGVGEAGETGDYRVAGYPNPVQVNGQLRRMQAALTRGNPEELAKYVQFPVQINSPSGTRLVNAEEWKAEFDRLFPGSARSALLKSPTRNLLATAQGIMIGEGEVWLTPGNGADPGSPPQIGVVNLALNP